MVKKVVFLGTGGTIAGTAASSGDNVGYTAAQVGIAALLESSPGLQHSLGGHVAEAEQVLQVNSKDMEFAGWQRILERVTHHLARPDVASVLLTHGTDTLEETAYFLNRVLPTDLLLDKAVVLTCAMRPASSASADGPSNLRDAAAVAVSSLRSGVLVVCAGTVHAGLRVQKVHPYRLNPFDSGDAGPVGYVEEGVYRRVAIQPQSPQGEPQVDWRRLLQVSCPRVEVIVSHSGSDGAIVRALLEDSKNRSDPLRGIVVAGTGNGAVHASLEQALREAQQAGVRVVRTTRCPYGEVVEGNAPAAAELPAAYVSAVKARIDLVLALADVIRPALQTPGR